MKKFFLCDLNIFAVGLMFAGMAERLARRDYERAATDAAIMTFNIIAVIVSRTHRLPESSHAL